MIGLKTHKQKIPFIVNLPCIIDKNNTKSIDTLACVEARIMLDSQSTHIGKADFRTKVRLFENKVVDELTTSEINRYKERPTKNGSTKPILSYPPFGIGWSHSTLKKYPKTMEYIVNKQSGVRRSQNRPIDDLAN